MEDEVKEPAPKYSHISPDEYLELERADEERNEYYNGEVYAMSGASMAHLKIEVNLARHIGNFLDGKPCVLLPANMRISTPSRKSYMYADTSIVCDETILEDDKFDTLKNPSVVFEILSPSTRSFDKGRKFMFYQQIPSLREYIMIDSQKKHLYVARKQADKSWTVETLDDQAPHLFIETINFEMPLDLLYKGTGL